VSAITFLRPPQVAEALEARGDKVLLIVFSGVEEFIITEMVGQESLNYAHLSASIHSELYYAQLMMPEPVIQIPPDSDLNILFPSSQENVSLAAYASCYSSSALTPVKYSGALPSIHLILQPILGR
jgi:hypothetical protein